MDASWPAWILPGSKSCNGREALNAMKKGASLGDSVDVTETNHQGRPCTHVALDWIFQGTTSMSTFSPRTARASK